MVGNHGPGFRDNSSVVEGKEYKNPAVQIVRVTMNRSKVAEIGA